MAALAAEGGAITPAAAAAAPAATVSPPARLPCNRLLLRHPSQCAGNIDHAACNTTTHRPDMSCGSCRAAFFAAPSLPPPAARALQPPRRVPPPGAPLLAAAWHCCCASGSVRIMVCPCLPSAWDTSTSRRQCLEPLPGGGRRCKPAVRGLQVSTVVEHAA